MTATGYVTPPVTGVEVGVNGVIVATRPELNVIAGTNVAVTGVDNPGQNRVDLTVTSTAGGAGPSGTVTTEIAFGQASSAGVAATYSRGDHTHGTPTAPTVPSASGTVAVETSYGVSSSAGAALTYSRGDHTHGSPSLTSSTPTVSTVGDAAGVGVATTPARADHTHGRESFAAVSSGTSYALATANGSAATVARSDHQHGTPPIPYVVPPFNVPGTVAVAVGTATFYNDSGRTLTILAVRTSVGTAPTGASLIVDINVNGTTIFTTQSNRPTITAGTKTSGKVTNMDVTTIADGQAFTVDVDQVGSSVPGSDLTVGITVV